MERYCDICGAYLKDGQICQCYNSGIYNNSNTETNQVANKSNSKSVKKLAIVSLAFALGGICLAFYILVFLRLSYSTSGDDILEAFWWGICIIVGNNMACFIVAIITGKRAKDNAFSGFRGLAKAGFIIGIIGAAFCAVFLFSLLSACIPMLFYTLS